jgi:hypothetical protein
MTSPSDIIARLRAVGAVQQWYGEVDGHKYGHATNPLIFYNDIADLIEAAPALADVVEAALATSRELFPAMSGEDIGGLRRLREALARLANQKEEADQ